MTKTIFSVGSLTHVPEGKSDELYQEAQRLLSENRYALAWERWEEYLLRVEKATLAIEKIDWHNPHEIKELRKNLNGHSYKGYLGTGLRMKNHSLILDRQYAANVKELRVTFDPKIPKSQRTLRRLCHEWCKEAKNLLKMRPDEMKALAVWA